MLQTERVRIQARFVGISGNDLGRNERARVRGDVGGPPANSDPPGVSAFLATLCFAEHRGFGQGGELKRAPADVDDVNGSRNLNTLGTCHARVRIHVPPSAP